MVGSWAVQSNGTNYVEVYCEQVGALCLSPTLDAESTLKNTQNSHFPLTRLSISIFHHFFSSLPSSSSSFHSFLHTYSAYTNTAGEPNWNPCQRKLYIFCEIRKSMMAWDCNFFSSRLVVCSGSGEKQHFKDDSKTKLRGTRPPNVIY